MNSCIDLWKFKYFFYKLGGCQSIARLIMTKRMCCSQDPVGEAELWMIINFFVFKKFSFFFFLFFFSTPSRMIPPCIRSTHTSQPWISFNRSDMRMDVYFLLISATAVACVPSLERKKSSTMWRLKIKFYELGGCQWIARLNYREHWK